MSDAARWPTAVDYQTALQTPGLCFNEPSLKRGVVALGPLGLPLAATGNVVAVFRMQADGQDLAVRCFTRKSRFEALERRYRALGTLADRFYLPALVDCAYRSDEVLVQGERYAIVQMEWVQGLQLHRFIETHLHQPDWLLALADQWRVLVAQLRTARIAHGDLSDGNILVEEKGRLRLVDYDAVYLPSLKDHPPDELGKPNYQHPDRLRPESDFYGYYAENADAFSALVIYLSLKALAVDPGLWDCFHAGENLLFQQADYGMPGVTPVWAALRESADREVRALTDALHRYCHTALDELPELEEVVLRIRMRAPLEVNVPVEFIGTEARVARQGLPVLEDARPARRVRMPLAQVWRRLGASLTRHRLMASIALLALLVLLVGGFWFSAGRTTQAYPMPIHQNPEVLVGTYDGYLSMPNGRSAPLTLIIDAVHPTGAKVLVSYTLIWTGGRVTGNGAYHPDTGWLGLPNSYDLFVATTEGTDIVLASTSSDEATPLVELRRSVVP